MRNLKVKFKQKILENQKLSNIVFAIINLKYFLVNSRSVSGKNNVIDCSKSGLYRNVKFAVAGNSNKISVASRCIIRNVSFEIKGSNNCIILEDTINIMQRGSFLISGDNCTITIGRNSVFRDANFFAGESNTTIKIGKNCLCGILTFSTSDFHSIIDLDSGKRINPPNDIKVGDNNWITNHVLIRKGAEIQNFTVVSPYSIVNKKYDQSNIILAGQPAKIVKENISWSSELLPY